MDAWGVGRRADRLANWANLAPNNAGRWLSQAHPGGQTYLSLGDARDSCPTRRRRARVAARVDRAAHRLLAHGERIAPIGLACRTRGDARLARTPPGVSVYSPVDSRDCPCVEQACLLALLGVARRSAGVRPVGGPAPTAPCAGGVAAPANNRRLSR